MRIGVVSDLHFREQGGSAASWHGPYDFHGLGDRVRHALARFEAEQVDVVLAAGDFAHEGDALSLAAAFSALGAATPPVYAIAGNHDLLGAHDSAASAASRAQVKLLDSDGASLDGVAAVGLQVRREGPSLIDSDVPAAGHRSVAPLSPAALNAPLTLVLSHFPVLAHEPLLAGHGLAHPGDLDDRERVAADLEASNGATVVICGHLHVRASVTEGRVLELLMPSLIEAPMEATIVDLDPEAREVTRTAVSLTDTENGGGPLLAPRSQTWRFDEAQGWRPH